MLELGLKVFISYLAGSVNGALLIGQFYGGVDVRKVGSGNAGGTNALASFDTGYLTLDRAQLQQTIRPDVILILEPGGSELADNDPRLRALDGLTVPAVMNRRFSVIQHPQAMLPSTALPEVLVEIATVRHPDRAAAIREAYDAAEQVLAKTSGGDGS